MRFFKQLTQTLLALVIGFTLCSSSLALKPKKDIIKYTGDIKFKALSTSVDLPFSYTAKKSREVAVAIWLGKKWITSKIITVKKGTSNIVITLPFKKEKLKRGFKYEMRYHIRPVGTTWKETINGNLIHFRAK